MTGPRVGSLFAGYGGLDQGTMAVFGGELAWYADICGSTEPGKPRHKTPHRAPCSIMAHHHPGVPNLGDVTTVDWSTAPPIDILTGGSPCQDLSHAGKRAGMTEGTRSNLWVSMRECIATMRPSLVIWENVRGAYSAEADSELVTRPGLLDTVRRRDGQPVLRALGRVLGDLSDLGYDTGWHGIRAADIGAPHGRFRVFVVARDASRDDQWHARIAGDDGSWGNQESTRTTDSSPAHAGCVQRGEGRTTAPGQEASRGSLGDAGGRGLLPTPRATDGTKGGPNQRGSSGDLMLPSAVALLPTPAVNDKTVDHWDEWTATMQAKHGNGNGHGKSLAIEAQRLLPTPRVGADRTSRSAAVRKDSRSSPSLGQAVEIAAGDLPHEFDSWQELPASWQNATDGARWGDYAAAIARWEHILGRPAPAPTMTSIKGNPQLSPHFVEFLMGLPAGHVTDVPGISRNEALKALGNGVVPQQAEAAIRWLLEHAL